MAVIRQQRLEMLDAAEMLDPACQRPTARSQWLTVLLRNAGANITELRDLPTPRCGFFPTCPAPGQLLAAGF